ncbi:MAG: hypothetical protein M1355_03845 [Patescibacteria group bacterium]|nr:hypothetical protein [Patescibacteria group bacterium]
MFYLLTLLPFILACLFIIITGITLYRLFWSFGENQIFYYPSNPKYVFPVLDKLINERFYKETENLNLVELGAGLCKVAKYLSKGYKWENIYAVEKEFFTYLASKLFLRNKYKIYLIREDVFTFETPKNSLIYCYFNNEIINNLYKAGKFKGNLMITLSSTIKGIKPIATYNVKGFQKALYLYDFRA